MTNEHSTDGQIEGLLDIMSRLRDPETGCPWDVGQDFLSIAPYTVEEAYEVADAVERQDWPHLCEELGDLLFQVVFHTQMAAERDWFGFEDVVSAISAKLIRRHPHVFAGRQTGSPAEQSEAWEAHKHAERAARGGSEAGVLGGVPLALPALLRAVKLQQRAARVSFDWGDTAGVLDKLEEEIRELRAALAEGSQQAVGEEMGDLLFSCVNLARRLGVNPETALRQTNGKFERRFRYIEERLAQTGRTPGPEVGLAELDALWEQAKREGV